MAGSPSRFVWYELMTPDPAAAQAFYAAVVGWGAQDASQPGKPYRLLTVGGAPIGGLMGLPRPGAPPCWCAISCCCPESPAPDAMSALFPIAG